MAISPVTVTFSLYDFLGFVPDTRRTKVVLTTNVASGFIADTSTSGGFRITDTRVTISSTGVASFSVLPSGATGLNPSAYQIRVQIDAANPATRQRAMVDLGYYTITAACDLKDLVATQYVPPTYLSSVTTLLDAKVTAAAGSATAAAGSATTATAAAALATSISGISTSDGVVTTLLGNPASTSYAKMVTRPQQSAEGTPTLLLSLPPKTTGVPPLEIVHNSFPNNLGAGTGYNQAVHQGWNVERHSTGTPVSGQPAWIMGMERNYYDWEGSLKYGPEFYLEHWSPNGTSVQMFRPIYARVEGADSNSEPYAVITHDIGQTTGGTFQVYRQGGTTRTVILDVNKNNIVHYADTYIQAPTLIVQPTTGQANLTLDSPSPPVVAFKVGGSAAWTLQAATVDSFAVYDKSGRAQVTLDYGATAPASYANVYSNLRVGSTAVTGNAYSLEVFGGATGGAQASLVAGRTWSVKSLRTGVNNPAGFAIRDDSSGADRLLIDTNGNVSIGLSDIGYAANGANTLIMKNGTAPTGTDPSAGAIYVQGGALKYRGSSGTVTTLAPA